VLSVKLTRRGLFRSGAVAGGAAAAAGAAPAASADSIWTPGRGSTSATVSGPAQGTTLARTFTRGTAGAGGYRPIVDAPGEPHLVRTDLGGTPSAGRAGQRKPLIAFAQLSDVHVVDAQSPMRVEWADRLDDESAVPATGLFASAYRPQEMLSGQIADAMVRRLNEITAGPVTGKPLALAIQTGDNSDNSQLNEIRWNIDVLDGGQVRVDSGDLSRWEGVHDGDPTYYDPHYWHPHGTPPGKADDLPRSQRGFPVVPGLLDTARRPFQAQGLSIPWYSAFGNHDGLAQGNFPSATLQLNLVATGPLKLMSTPAGLSPAAVVNALQNGSYAALLASLALSPAVRLVSPDPRRRLLTRKQIVEEHFKTAGLPAGHGFTAENRAKGTAYYTFDRGLCRFVVLDTVNPNGYSDGSIDQTQFNWLKSVLAASTDRLVMVFSHHTSDTMTNGLNGPGLDTDTRILGDVVLAELLAHDQVIAWINGHTHKNQIWARRRPGGGGLWEINTASHIDWPSQSRIVEIADNRDGTLSLFTTIVDHAGPASYGGNTGDSTHLAGLARELSANDWHNRGDGYRGATNARNVELVLPAPAFLRP
jgi:metallophosphoesterase (TIGR03767 family)